MSRTGTKTSAKAVNYEEAREQVDVVTQLKKQGLHYCAIPNGHVRNRKNFDVETEGIIAGAPDLLIFNPPPAVPYAIGVALEMKRVHGGVVRPEQYAFLLGLARLDWLVIVGHGSGDAVAKLRLLGLLDGFTGEVRESLLHYPRRYARLKALIERAAPLEEFLPSRKALNAKEDQEDGE